VSEWKINESIVSQSEGDWLPFSAVSVVFAAFGGSTSAGFFPGLIGVLLPRRDKRRA
jgi:hypothetical protein